MEKMSSHHLVTVVPTHGGCGASWMTANLSVGLALHTRQSVLAIDSSPASGGLELALGIDSSTRKFILPWQHPELLKGYLPRHPSGVDVLNLAEWMKKTPLAGWKEYLTSCQMTYPWVVLDVGEWHEAILDEVFEGASMNLLVATHDPMGLKGVDRWRTRLQQAHLPLETFQLVMNKDKAYEEGEVEALRRVWPLDVWMAIPEAAEVIQRSIREGHPLVMEAAHQGVGRVLHQLVLKINEEAKRGNFRNASPGSSNGQGDDHALKQRVHRRLVDELKVKYPGLDVTANVGANTLLRESARSMIEHIFSEEAVRIPERDHRSRVIQEIIDEALGLGPLEDFLRDPEVTEVMVNGKDQIFVERSGRLEKVDRVFESDRQVLAVIERIVVPIGRRIDESVPLVDARLPDGSRVNAIIPPLALNGPTLTIRKFSKKRMTLEELVAKGSVSPAVLQIFGQAVEGRKNIVVSGGTGSGKTTLLNALSSLITSEERIVTIEDSAELQLAQPHVIRLETRPPNLEGKGAIQIRDLVRNALRMRPDRIVVGECRGGEALDMLQAMNTGHDGSMTTVHANSPPDALSRIETMVLMAGMDLPLKAVREQVASAVHVIVQVARFRDGTRKVTEVAEVVGLEGDHIQLNRMTA